MGWAVDFASFPRNVISFSPNATTNTNLISDDSRYREKEERGEGDKGKQALKMSS